MSIFATRIDETPQLMARAVLLAVAIPIAIALHRRRDSFRFGWVAFGGVYGFAWALTCGWWESYTSIRIVGPFSFGIEYFWLPLVGAFVGALIDLTYRPPKRLQFGMRQLFMIVTIAALVAYIVGLYLRYK